MKTLPLLIAALLASSIAATADAAEPEASHQRVVSFADLDLEQPAGVEQLYRRITAAAEETCWTGGVLERVMPARMRRCAERAIAQAVADVNAPLLTRHHIARNGTTDSATVIAFAPGTARQEAELAN